MTLYEYQCTCGYRFEERRPVSERETAQCPKCGAKAHKIFSVFNTTHEWVLDSLVDDIPRII